MSGDAFDEIMRQAAPPPVTVSEARLQRLIRETVARTEHPSWRERLERILNRYRLAPVMHYALPMLVAVILGVSVNQSYSDELPVAQFSTVMFSSTLMPSSGS